MPGGDEGEGGAELGDDVELARFEAVQAGEAVEGLAAGLAGFAGDPGDVGEVGDVAGRVGPGGGDDDAVFVHVEGAGGQGRLREHGQAHVLLGDEDVDDAVPEFLEGGLAVHLVDGGDDAGVAVGEVAQGGDEHVRDHGGEGGDADGSGEAVGEAGELAPGLGELVLDAFGVSGEDAPGVVNAYIEIVPTDAVKYELDKRSGHLKVDRPQRFSSFPPTLYGFIPQTFCGDRVAELCRRCPGRGRPDTRRRRPDGHLRPHRAAPPRTPASSSAPSPSAACA